MRSRLGMEPPGWLTVEDGAAVLSLLQGQLWEGQGEGHGHGEPHLLHCQRCRTRPSPHTSPAQRFSGVWAADLWGPHAPLGARSPNNPDLVCLSHCVDRHTTVPGQCQQRALSPHP